MSVRSFLLGTGALLTVWTGTASAGAGDTFRLGMNGEVSTMTLAGKGDADTIQVRWGGGRGGWGGGWHGGWRGGWGGWGGGWRGGWGGWRGGWGWRTGWGGGWGWRGRWWGGPRFGWYGGWGSPWVGYGLSYYPQVYYSWPPAFSSFDYGCSLPGNMVTTGDEEVAPANPGTPARPDLLPPPTRAPGRGTFQDQGVPRERLPLPPSDRIRRVNPRPPAGTGAPDGGTYRYDGGPQRPVPMPEGDRTPTLTPRASTPDGLVVSLTGKPKKIAYRAYGEQTIEENAPFAPAIRVAQRPSREGR
jgi:hypothetical protein